MGFRNLLVKAGLAAGKVAAKFDPSGIASGLLDAYSKHQEKQQLRSEIEEMISAGFEKFRGELGEAMGELKSQLPESMRPQVEAYLSQFQTSAKQASRALGDPSGTTVPVTVAVDEPEQLAAFLPQRQPRFTVGASVPGLPSWKLVEPLGAGGFGEVWKAENPYSGTAAFKFFLDPTARNRFTRTEAANIAEIFKRAPTDGVVKLLGAEPEQEPPWLQFEYISGGDLSRLPERWKGVTAEERVKQASRVVRTLAKTAGHFHNLGVVHRDLKPSNILLRKADSGYKLVIADFGISKIIPAGLSPLPTPANSGTATIRAYTALYASPQQKKFRPADRRDDVYALGVLWYQLLRGDLNLERPSGEGWKRALKNLGVGEAIIGLLNRCWDDEADERPMDGNALLTAIRELDPVTVQVPQLSAPLPAVRVVAQHQPPVPATAPPILPASFLKPAPPPAPPLEARRPERPRLAPAALVNASPPLRLETGGKDVHGASSPEPTTAELTVDEAIRQFESAGGERGATATAGNKYYETAARLRFVRCCGWDDAAYNSHEFIARNSRGTCYYVCHNLSTGRITIGPKGYHFCKPDVPECVPGSAPRARSEPSSTEPPPSQSLPRTGRLLEERTVLPRGTWWVELPESEADQTQSEEHDSQEEDGEEIAEEVGDDEEEDNNWQLVCGTPAQVELREGELYYLRLAATSADDLFGLEALADVQQLHTIGIGNDANLSVPNCALFAGFRYLAVLDLCRSSVDDATLQFFEGLAALQVLRLSETRIEGSGLTHLVGLLNLEALDLSGTPLGDADFSCLARLPKFESLRLSETGLRDSDLPSLCGVPKLKTLMLNSTPITDAGLVCLGSCAGLNELSLGRTAISDDGLGSISGLRSLAHLTLDGCRGVTDEGLKQLLPLTNIETLDLGDTGIGDTGLAHLREMRSLYALSLNGCGVTNAGLMHLRVLTNLQVLDLTGTKVTRKGVSEFKGALPGCEVFVK